MTTSKNAACLCGSGKKFKNCHGRQERTRHTRVLDGEAAILGHLKQCPQAQELAARIFRFYGASFQYHEDASFDFSKFEINFDHEPTRFHSGVVRLRLGTSRTAEALVHELLHLQQPILGFPRLVQCGVPDTLKHFIPKLRLFEPILLNIVDHEIMIDSFVGLGFGKTRFLTKSREPSNSDYETHVRQVELGGLAGLIEFPWWCVEFYRHWLAERHGLVSDAGKQAEMVLRWGTRLYPELEVAAGSISDWTERGDFKSPYSYAAAIEGLFRIMRLPQVPVWYRLEASPSGAPVASRLNENSRD